MTNNELTYAMARARSLFIGIAEMDAFPDPCIDDLVDSLAEPEPQMVEGRMSRAVRDHWNSRLVAEERGERLGHRAANLTVA